jgi:hypothetical protein
MNPIFSQLGQSRLLFITSASQTLDWQPRLWPSWHTSVELLIQCVHAHATVPQHLIIQNLKPLFTWKLSEFLGYYGMKCKLKADLFHYTAVAFPPQVPHLHSSRTTEASI